MAPAAGADVAESVLRNRIHVVARRKLEHHTDYFVRDVYHDLADFKWTVWYGMVWYGMIWYGMVWRLSVSRFNTYYA